MMRLDRRSRIYVAGHNGLVGSAIVRRLSEQGFVNLILRDRRALDLTNQEAVRAFFASEKIDYVFLAAAKVGGILANDTYPADYLRENLAIQTNAIEAAYQSGVKKLLFLGSSCIYPKLAPQPIDEDSLLTGPLEATNQWYAIAKIAGLKLCQAYRRQFGFNSISLMPTNLYGPGDNFDLSTSHVLPALIRKFDEAKRSGAQEVEIWGTGSPRREFLHVDDLASACLYLMQNYDDEQPLNVGWGKDLTIRQLAETVQAIIGHKGQLRFDTSRPDGTPQKLLSTSRLTALGWQPRTELSDGIRSTYDWYLANRGNLP